MFPNATRGYMPYVSDRRHTRRPGSSRRSSSCRDSDRSKKKAYQVTLRDKHGFTYTYIIKSDGTKSSPVLCDSSIAASRSNVSSSLPDFNARKGSLTSLNSSSCSLGSQGNDSVDGDKKQGLIATIIRFLSKKAKPKSKRKPSVPEETAVKRKRQRTISAMSNLDPIQESPDEDEDSDSYIPDSDVSSTGSTGS